MEDNGRVEPQRIRDRLAGQHILVTGSTGFLAKAFIEKLLRYVDTIGGIHLLVRVRSDGTSARQRVMREVIGSHAFDRLRAALGEGFERLCEEKLHIWAGDLTTERLGMPKETYDSLRRQITLVVNSAATVTFDERIDLAIELNTLGPPRLLRLARDCGGIPFLHVSTCYVCGLRSGTVVEDFSAPEPARETLPRNADTGSFDLDGLVEAVRAEAAELRHRLGADSEMCRRELIDAGMRRARSLGWNDTYTFTKWLGEQLLIRDRGDLPLVIFRPAIIEGSFEEPMPGWIDGLRMADPIIVAYGKGKLKEFPGAPGIAIDLIPVDFVANAMIATLPVGRGWRSGLCVYHCASSERNPLRLEVMRDSVMKAYRKRPMSDDNGRPIRPGPLRLVDHEAFLNQWRKRQRRLERLQRILHAVGIRGRRYRRLSGMVRQIEQLTYFAKIYTPYTHLNCRFADDALRGVAERLHPEDRVSLPYDPQRIDWEDYLVNRHVPGLRSFVLGLGGEPTPRILAGSDWEPAEHGQEPEALHGANLFDVFQRAARRFPDKSGLQVRREGRWVRYTYEEALRATGTILRRFAERGLKPGDRVVICGDNGPEWGLTYLAAMRGGLTAVPLDPQLPPGEAWAAARFAEAKLMCATPSTFGGLSGARKEDDAPIVQLREPFIPKPGASRDDAPEPVAVDDTAVASILFTSGTTVSPKAVQLTHHNLIANAGSLVKVHRIGPADQLLSVLPMYHVFEFTGGFLVPLSAGATITYVEQLKGPEILSAMQTTGTTIMLVVPRLLKMFHDAVQQAVRASGIFRRTAFRILGVLSAWTGHGFARRFFRSVHRRFGGSLQMFVCGGSRLEPDLFEAFRRLGFAVYEGYGLTETAPVLTLNPPGRAKAGSVGPAVPGVEMEVRDQNLEGVGEVWVRGPNLLKGYLKNPEATAEVLVDGWLRTGDLGRLDEDGYLHLTGRSKDLIVTAAGKNVYPDEVEARYRDLPYVNELCVFGMPADDGLGDAVHAVVVLDSQTTAELDRSSKEREVRLAVAGIGERLASHQRIATLHFWNHDLPKTSTLKAKRGLIREVVTAERTAEAGAAEEMIEGAGGDVAASGRGPADTGPNADIVRGILSQHGRHRHGSVGADMHLQLDLGIDSIGKLEVLSELEARFGVQVNGETASRIARAGDLFRLVADRRPRGAAVEVARLPTTGGAISAPAGNGETEIATTLLPLRWMVRGGVLAFMHSYVRVHGRGWENIPRRGAFVLAPNHSSHLDAPAVLTGVGGKRRVWVAGAEDYFFNTRIKSVIFGKLLDTIPVDRQADGLVGLRRCSEALGRGDGLLIFPEGTRSPTGDLQPFKIGVAVLAMERKAPIVPVFVHHAFDLLPKGSRFIKPGAITVTFGTPIAPPEVEHARDRYAAYRQLAREVELAVAAMAAEARV